MTTRSGARFRPATPSVSEIRSTSESDRASVARNSDAVKAGAMDKCTDYRRQDREHERDSCDGDRDRATSADVAKHRPSARAVQSDSEQHRFGEVPPHTMPRRQPAAPPSSTDVCSEIGAIKRPSRPACYEIFRPNVRRHRYGYKIFRPNVFKRTGKTCMLPAHQPARSATTQKTTRQCYGCGVAGHFVMFCPNTEGTPHVQTTTPHWVRRCGNRLATVISSPGARHVGRRAASPVSPRRTV